MRYVFNDILHFAPSYQKELDILSYTNIFSANIKPADVEKALNDLRIYNIDVHEKTSKINGKTSKINEKTSKNNEQTSKNNEKSPKNNDTLNNKP